MAMTCSTFRYSNADHTWVTCTEHGDQIPVAPGNRHWDSIVERGCEILPYLSPEALEARRAMPYDAMVDGANEMPTLTEIHEAYEASHDLTDMEPPHEANDEGAGDVGLAEHSGADLGGDGGEHVEAPEDDPAGEPVHFSAEPMGDDSALGEPGAYPGMMIDHQHTETLLYNLREGPIKLVRDFYESRLTHELGDQDMRNALAFSDDSYRDEKLAWIAAMDAVLEQKLAEIAEMDGMALANYRGEAEGWPPVPVEEVEYEDDEPEGE